MLGSHAYRVRFDDPTCPAKTFLYPPVGDDNNWLVRRVRVPGPAVSEGICTQHDKVHVGLTQSDP
ncbi:MAG: hypothetical protein ACREV9_03355 [Burkholderiales bacterium]